MSASKKSTAFAGETLPSGVVVPEVAAPSPEYRAEGKQARGTFFEIETRLEDSAQLLELLVRTVREMGATIIKGTEMHHTNGEYILAGLGLEESSAFVHIFRDTRSGTADIFTCGDTVDPRNGMAILDRELRPKQMLVSFFGRGDTDIEPEEYVISEA